MSKKSSSYKAKNTKTKIEERRPGHTENQNQNHNTQKEALGRNTDR